MPNYYAQAILPSQTGETADVLTNVFAVQSTVDLTQGIVDDWHAAITAFYDACVTATFYAGYTDSGARVKYLLADLVSPNYPLFEENLTVTPTFATVDLPREVSLCVSYMNETETQVPRARRRGRIYVSGFLEITNTSGRPATGTQSTLANAYQDYAEAVNAITELTAGVWSRITGDVYPINICWVDDEWDIMRSRGTKPTTRVDRVIV